MNEPDAKCPHCEAVTKIGGHGFTGQDATIHGQKVYLVEAVAKLQFLQQQPLKNACFAAFRRENAGAWAKGQN